MSDEAATTGEQTEQQESVGLGSIAWVLILAGLLTLATVGWHFWRLHEIAQKPPLADSKIAFDVACLVPRERIVFGAPTGSIPRLVPDPPTLSAEEAGAFKLGRGKFLVKGDPVIGVALNGEARAYPIRFLDFHEVVNDTVGGTPIAITWSPLSGSAAVFARRIGGTRHVFAASGLLFNSSQTLSSEQDPTSLWSQLQARAIAGPAAQRAQVLERVPFTLMRWGDWLEAHPETRVLKPAAQLTKAYKRYPYRNYLGSDTLRFPAEPLPPEGMKKKTPVLVVRAGGQERVYPLPRIAEQADANGAWTAQQGGVELTFRYWDGGREDNPPTAVVTAPNGEPIEVWTSFWFAWYATHPECVLVSK